MLPFLGWQMSSFPLSNYPLFLLLLLSTVRVADEQMLGLIMGSEEGGGWAYSTALECLQTKR